MENEEKLVVEDKQEKPREIESDKLKSSISSKKQQIKDETKSTEIVYKLNFRKTNGDIRSDISKAVIYTLCVDWADLLRIIPAYRWSTVEEIAQLVWDWEKRQYRKLYSRTRKQIEDGIMKLREAGVLDAKEK